ncbi:MAG: NUDIX hydrolase [Sarcina sp.]
MFRLFKDNKEKELSESSSKIVDIMNIYYRKYKKDKLLHDGWVFDALKSDIVNIILGKSDKEINIELHDVRETINGKYPMFESITEKLLLEAKTKAINERDNGINDNDDSSWLNLYNNEEEVIEAKKPKVLGIGSSIENKYVNLYDLNAKDKEGILFDYYMVSRNKPEDLILNTKENKPNGVMIIPELSDGKYAILKQYRYTIDDYLYEFPAGRMEEEDTDLFIAAARELNEETGLTFDNAEVLVGCGYTSISMTDESVTMITAKCYGKINSNEDTEYIKVLCLTLDELVKLTKTSNIKIDIKTLLAIQLLDAKRNIKE